MRFRQKFHWLQLATAAMWIVTSSLQLTNKHHPGGMRGASFLTGLLWAYLGFFSVLSYFRHYCEVRDDGLFEHRVWSSKLIPWDEITRVGPWRPFRNAHSKMLEIEYYRPAPMSDRGSIFLQPGERETFLNALHTHAPQAAFEL